MLIMFETKFITGGIYCGYISNFNVVAAQTNGCCPKIEIVTRFRARAFSLNCKIRISRRNVRNHDFDEFICGSLLNMFILQHLYHFNIGHERKSALWRRKGSGKNRCPRRARHHKFQKR